jgi:hypothetical protein
MVLFCFLLLYLMMLLMQNASITGMRYLKDRPDIRMASQNILDASLHFITTGFASMVVGFFTVLKYHINR